MPHKNGSVQEPAVTEASGSPEPNREPVNAEARRLDAPTFYAAAAQVLISGNDASLLFTRPHPAMLPDGTLASAPMREPVALVQMSIAGMKDLALILSDMVRRIEQQTGEIQSELSGRSNLAVPTVSKRQSNGH